MTMTFTSPNVHGIELIWYNSTIEVTLFAATMKNKPCPFVSYKN